MASPDYDLSADRSSPVMLCPYLLYNSEAGGPGHLCKSEIQNSMGEIVDKTLLKTYNLSVNLVGAYLNSTLNPEAFKPRDCFFSREKELLHVWLRATAPSSYAAN